MMPLFHSNKSSCPISQKDRLETSALESWLQYASNNVLIVWNVAVPWVNKHRTVCRLFHYQAWGLWLILDNNFWQQFLTRANLWQQFVCRKPTISRWLLFRKWFECRISICISVNEQDMEAAVTEIQMEMRHSNPFLHNNHLGMVGFRHTQVVATVCCYKLLSQICTNSQWWARHESGRHWGLFQIVADVQFYGPKKKYFQLP